MAAVRHLEFAKIAILVTWPISACDPSSLFQISRWTANMAPRYSQKQFSIWRPSAILNLKNFDFFVKFPMASSELKCTSVYQIWSKSDNSRLRSVRCGDNAIFKMAAVRHLEFAKIAVLVTWPISACDPSSAVRSVTLNLANKFSQCTFSVTEHYDLFSDLVILR